MSDTTIVNWERVAGEISERLSESEQRVDFLRTQVTDLCAAIDGKNKRIAELAGERADVIKAVRRISPARSDKPFSAQIAECVQQISAVLKIGEEMPRDSR